MKKRIILLSDGTGNAASRVWRTNVWRVFESIDLTGSDQVAIYDDGVGTSSFKPLALLGGAFGWGLKRNVLDLYKFVCRNYEDENDEIFGFGFSRGAFTIRVVIGLICNQGLVRFDTERQLHQGARDAYREFRRENFHTILRIEDIFRWLRDLVIPGSYDKKSNREVRTIHFLGLWDTVAAYGLPIEEMTRGVSQWLWPLELPERRLSDRVLRACHALSLDDERTTFHPVLWNEADEKPVQPDAEGVRWTKAERISQVWFAGVHSNVGGGYPDDSLAHIPLYWIMCEAHDCGLKFKHPPQAQPDAVLRAKSAQDKDGRLYDPRKGLGGYYRYGPRKISDLCHMRFSSRPDDEVQIGIPKIHESVLKRIRQGAQTYSPIGLPESYQVVTDQREILAPQQNDYEPPVQAAARFKVQEQIVWNLVWARRVVYFATVAASLHLALYPLSRALPPSGELSTWLRPVSDLIRLIEQFLPGPFAVWVNAYAREPGRFLLAALAVGVLIWLGSVVLSTKITDQMRTIWRANPATAQPSQWGRLLFSIRTHPVYKRILSTLKYTLAPAFFAIVFLYLGLTLTSHLIFNFEDSAGFICRNSERLIELARGDTSPEIRFSTRDICKPTGVALEAGRTYRITVRQVGPWRDGRIDTSTSGYYSAELDWGGRTLKYLAWPLKRSFIRPWFRMVTRVGSTGNYENFLDPDPPPAPKGFLQEQFRPGRSGELFVYVNEAVTALPWLQDLFYQNNEGEAAITIQRL